MTMIVVLLAGVGVALLLERGPGAAPGAEAAVGMPADIAELRAAGVDEAAAAEQVRTPLSNGPTVALLVVDHRGEPVPEVAVHRGVSDGSQLTSCGPRVAVTDAAGRAVVPGGEDFADDERWFARPAASMAVAFEPTAVEEWVARLPQICEQAFRCVDARDGAAVGGALVVLSAGPTVGLDLPEQANVADCSPGAAPLFVAVADAEGRARFGAVPRGGYVASADAPGWVWVEGVERDELLDVPADPEIELHPLLGAAVAVDAEHAIACRIEVPHDQWGDAQRCAPAVARARRQLEGAAPNATVIAGLPERPLSSVAGTVHVLWLRHGVQELAIDVMPIPDGVEPLVLRPPAGEGPIRPGRLQVDVLWPDGTPAPGLELSLVAQVRTGIGSHSTRFEVPCTSGVSLELPPATWSAHPRGPGLSEHLAGARLAEVIAGGTSRIALRMKRPVVPCRIVVNAGREPGAYRLRDATGAETCRFYFSGTVRLVRWLVPGRYRMTLAVGGDRPPIERWLEVPALRTIEPQELRIGER